MSILNEFDPEKFVPAAHNRVFGIHHVHARGNGGDILVVFNLVDQPRLD